MIRRFKGKVVSPHYIVYTMVRVVGRWQNQDLKLDIPKVVCTFDVWTTVLSAHKKADL